VFASSFECIPDPISSCNTSTEDAYLPQVFNRIPSNEKENLVRSSGTEPLSHISKSSFIDHSNHFPVSSEGDHFSYSSRKRLRTSSFECISDPISSSKTGKGCSATTINRSNPITVPSRDFSMSHENSFEIVPKVADNEILGTIEKPNIMKPKRPRTAYNFFFQQERAKLLGFTPTEDQFHMHTERQKKRRHRKSHGKMGFKEMVKYMAERWSQIDSKSRDFFESKAATDKERYRRESNAYKEHLT